MTSGKITKPFELSECFMFGTRISAAGERFTIDKTWRERDFTYCHVSSDAGGGSNFEMLAVIENAGIKYLVLTSTPDVSIDDPCITGMVVRLNSPESATTILEEELNYISESCMSIVALTRQQRTQSIADYFGEIENIQ